MKKALPFILIIVYATYTFAYDYDFSVKSNYVNVYYKITDPSISNRTVEVVKGPQKYPRPFDVPSIVTYNGKKYKVTGIAEDLFFDNKAITYASIPNTVTYIGPHAYSRTSITTLEIPESVTSIGTLAFAQNKSLKTVSFPNSVVDVDINLFTGCDSITHSVYNDRLYVHHAYFDREPVMNVPEGIKIIVGGASYQSPEVEQTLTEIILPKSVDSLQQRAIRGENLKKLTIKAPFPPRCHEETTYPLDIIPNITVYVSNADPAILERYKADQYWSQFNIVATDLSDDDPKVRADVNGDSVVNAADVVSIYNYIISGEESSITKDKADVNEDDDVNAADVVSVYNYITTGEQ